VTLESTLGGVCGQSSVENKDYIMMIQGHDQLPTSGYLGRFDRQAILNLWETMSLQLAPQTVMGCQEVYKNFIYCVHLGRCFQ
jgi:hypothetical protein